MLELPPGRPATHPALYALGGFLVGVVLTAAWFLEARLPRAGEAVPGTSAAQESGTTSPVAPSASGVVSVHDQKAGMAVAVDAVNVPAPGAWAAVEELQNGDLGNILGAARVVAPAANLTVPLLRATAPGNTYAVVLYRDNGDGTFDAKTDSVYVDFDSGERVVALFRTTL